MLDTAVVLAATIVAILAGVRFRVEGRRLDLLLAAGFSVAAAGTLAFAILPVMGGDPQGAPEAWAGLGARVLAATLIALAPVVPGGRIAAPDVRFRSRSGSSSSRCSPCGARCRRQATPSRRSIARTRGRSSCR